MSIIVCEPLTLQVLCTAEPAAVVKVTKKYIGALPTTFYYHGKCALKESGEWLFAGHVVFDARPPARGHGYCFICSKKIHSGRRS